ncbi:MAG: altronate dehydratase family protein [Armatimonadota bacterium]|nr:altronate dehydratase family protein [Armatimonadota bacterium]MCX7778432.1 altronate dehydratase family protein [Armatimonadota bacterium]MDW8025052.1 altronate dehydratase family protein [Armatimonadota bacterium]
MGGTEAVALVIDAADNVATALTHLMVGQRVKLVGSSKRGFVKAKDDVRLGHKIAIRSIKSGEPVIKYGEVIGRATRNIAVGEHVHTHNLVGIRGSGQKVLLERIGKPQAHKLTLPEDVPKEFRGYRRADGRCATRNIVLILPTVVCANRVAEQIASSVNGAVSVTHPYGCTFSQSENAFLKKIFVNYASNPNVAGVVIVALGCETVDFAGIADELAKVGQVVELITIQNDGGSDGSIRKGVKAASMMMAIARRLRREAIPMSELTIAVECGGSDTFSGLTANPTVGYACDLHTALGGTVILSETAEVIGAEHIVAARAINESVARDFLRVVERVERSLAKVDAPEVGAYITRGNIEGGLTTLEEKSLGCIRKAGTSSLCEVVPYGERPRRRGLIFMDTPGQDVKSVTGMVAGGAQLVLFTTGRGTPVGCPIAPVIKVGSNRKLVEKMPMNIDLDTSTIADGTERIEDVGLRLYKLVADVASGRLTRSEEWRHNEFALPTEGVITGCRPDG